MVSILSIVLSLMLSKGAAEEAPGFFCSLCVPRNMGDSTVDAPPTMLFPERIVPDSDWTCKEVDEMILSGLALDTCEDMIASLPNHASIDLAAFCGCDGATSTTDVAIGSHPCSFCSGSTTSSSAPSSYLNILPPRVTPPVSTREPSSSPSPSPYVSATFAVLAQSVPTSEPSFHNEGEILVGGKRQGPPDMGSGSSFEDFCLDLSTMAPYVKDADYCDTMIKPMEQMCCPTEGIDATRCSLCPAGSVMEHPYREIPLWNGDFSTVGGTCQQLEDEFATISLRSCEQAKVGVGSGTLDLPSFCGCRGVEIPNPCSFCSPEDMVNPDYDISELVNYNFTCKGASDLAPFIHADSVICHDRFNLIRKGCCREEERCLMCADGKDEIAFPGKILAMNPEPQTCADLQLALGFMDQDECAEIRSSFPLDFAAYCGCSGASSQNECSLCAGGFEVLHDNPASDGVSCGEIDDLTRYVNDPDLCASFQAFTRPKCCAVKEEVSPSEPDNSQGLENTISSGMPLEDYPSSSKGNNDILYVWQSFGFFVIQIILAFMKSPLE